MDESVTGSANFFFGPMEIEAATSPDDLQAFARVVERVHRLRISVPELQHDLVADPDTRFFVARVDGEIIGSGVGKRSSQNALYGIARVLPEVRRRGAGMALYEALSAHAQTLGLTSLWGRVDDAAGLEFALNRGFRETGRDVESVLELDRAPAPESPPAGVDITSLGDRPDLAQACHAVDTEALPDIPAELEVQPHSFERWRADNLEGPAALPHACKVALVDGAVVGYAAMLARTAEPGTAEHQLTGVKRAWRRRGIATALKRAQIAWAAENGFERLVTYNDETNVGMRGVNSLLGYVPQPPIIVVHGPLAG